MAADKERGPGSASADIGKYLDILAKDPNSRVFAPLAEAYRKAGLLEDAIETALEGLKVHPNYLGGRVALGRAYFEKRQYAEAAAEMQKVVASAPDNLMAHKVLGQVAFAQNDLPAAEKSFKMVLLLDPRDQEAQQFVANVAGGASPGPARAAPQTAAPPQATAVAPPPFPAARQPSPPAAPSLPAPEVIPFDEIQPLEELDLSSGGLLDEAPPPPAQAPPQGPEDLSRGEFPIELPLDLAAPEPWLPPPQPPPTAAPSGPVSAVAATEPGPVMELEVFSREPWGAEKIPETGEAEPGSDDGESPIEVFGRHKHGGPPPSTKGEILAYQEIEIEQTAHTSAQEELPSVDEPLFEVFTREPAARTPPPEPRPARGQAAGPRELEIETTSFTPPELFFPESAPAQDPGFEIEATSHAADGGAAVAEEPEPFPDEDLPGIDLAQDVVEEPAGEGPGPEARLDGPLAAEVWIEEDEAPETLQETSTEAPSGVSPGIVPDEPEAGPEDDEFSVVSLDEEIPSVDLSQEFEEDGFGDEDEDEESTPAGPAAGDARGVFDTETLATIYVNQGFYGRAAEIYRRLTAQRPDDEGLRNRLEGVLAREREEAGQGGPAAAPAADAVLPEPVPAGVAAGAPEDPRIRQLQTLLEAFRGGRPT